MTSMQLPTVLMVAATTTAEGGYSIQNIFIDDLSWGLNGLVT